jgi:glycolate oxidase FAD binding subunit
VKTIEPASADELSAAMAAAVRANERVLVRGGGTKMVWSTSAAANAADVMISTRRLDRIIAHRAGDLTATIEAGAPLDAVNRELRRHGQWIPLDPPWSDRATIGGIVAANDSGPRRHRYGSVRDLIIGVDIVRADGVRAKGGGIVVKNVAGYDLPRLMVGSFGCLAVIASATFKLYPISAASATVVADLPSHAAAGVAVAQLNRSQLTPSAVEIATPPLRLVMRFESTAASVEQQCARAVEIVAASGGTANIVRENQERERWDAHAAGFWDGSGAIAKVTLLPADLASTLDRVAEIARDSSTAWIGRACLGVLMLRIDGSTELQTRIVRDLRNRETGSAVLLRASDELKAAAGVWGPMGDAFGVMRSVKRSFDPQGVLNAGRGPGGM